MMFGTCDNNIGSVELTSNTHRNVLLDEGFELDLEVGVGVRQVDRIRILHRERPVVVVTTREGYRDVRGECVGLGHRIHSL